MSHSRLAACAVALTGALLSAGQSSPAPVAAIPRFARADNPIALTGPVRPLRYMEASGRRAALLGREDGSFEAWVYPLKVLHGFELSFGTPAYADPIPGSNLASSVEVRPEASVVRYSHDSFTADATWFVPLDEPGGVVLLDINTSVPLEITVKFRIDLKPMWPAALGGQSSYWDNTVKAYVAGEASRKHAALIGSPFARTPPEQPAHNLPDAPSQFTLAVTPADAARGLIPIAIAASHEGPAAARKTYAGLLGEVEPRYRATEAHYRRLREEMTSIGTPDPRINLAFEWGKVALDKGFVCNPHLGCGLIAGLGPSGTTERPGFGWFFGGDAFMNAWAISGYGDHATVKKTLEFLRIRQRADGKMMHELSQGAGYLRWFEDFPYGYYHADTTPLYIVAVRDYVRASGDDALARDFWPSIRKAYDYCASTDEDGDGLMDNTKAGLAAVETGKLRRADVLTDVYLAAVWTEATDAAAELATIAGDGFAARAREAHTKARASINTRFLDDEGKRIYYAWMKSGTGQAEATAWSAVGIWRGAFDATRPAVAGMLDELARPGIGADWGARLLSRESQQYEPQSYNNGAVWPFLTGFVTLALYSQHRADAAWPYLDGTAELAFIDGRGYTTELLSGDRLRPLDTSVPHQLFSTSGFVSGFIRGLVGLREPAATDPDAAIVLEPQLPPDWPALDVRRLRWRDATFDLTFVRSPDAIDVRVRHAGTPRPVVVKLVLPPGAVPPRGVREIRFDGRAPEEKRTVTFQPGIVIAPVRAPLRVGDPSQRLRVISTSFDGARYLARLEGRRGHTYALQAYVPFRVESIAGGENKGGLTPSGTIIVTFPGEGDGWGAQDLVINVGRRVSDPSRR
jgi:glycogen debranching enzyme